MRNHKQSFDCQSMPPFLKRNGLENQQIADLLQICDDHPRPKKTTKKENDYLFNFLFDGWLLKKSL